MSRLERIPPWGTPKNKSDKKRKEEKAPKKVRKGSLKVDTKGGIAGQSQTSEPDQKSGRKRKACDTDMDSAQLRIELTKQGGVRLRGMSQIELREKLEGGHSKVELSTPDKTKLRRVTTNDSLDRGVVSREETALLTGAIPKVKRSSEAVSSKKLAEIDRDKLRHYKLKPSFEKVLYVIRALSQIFYLSRIS